MRANAALRRMKAPAGGVALLLLTTLLARASLERWARLTFMAVSLHSHVLFHWAAPGYPMLLPLLGEAVARRRSGSRPIRIYLAATAMTVTLGVVFVASEARFNWLPAVFANFALDADPQEYGLAASAGDHAGEDVLIVAPRTLLAQVTAQFGVSFDALQALPPAIVRHAGRPAMLPPLYMAHSLHRPAAAMH